MNYKTWSSLMLFFRGSQQRRKEQQTNERLAKAIEEWNRLSDIEEKYEELADRLAKLEESQ